MKEKTYKKERDFSNPIVLLDLENGTANNDYWINLQLQVSVFIMCLHLTHVT